MARAMLRAVLLSALLSDAAAVLTAEQSAFTCKGVKPYVEAQKQVVYIHGVRQYIPTTGPGISAGAGGGYTMTVNGEVGSTFPQKRPNATAGTNITVVISGPAPFVGVVLTSYQFTDRPGANLYVNPGVATNYNCSTQTGYLDSVQAGTPTNTVAYFGAPISTLTTSFLLANYSESTTLKWFIQPAASTPVTWYGPFPQVVNVYKP